MSQYDGKEANYRVQDIACCETCKYVIFEYEGERGCERRVVYSPEYLNICDLYEHV